MASSSFLARTISTNHLLKPESPPSALPLIRFVALKFSPTFGASSRRPRTFVVSVTAAEGGGRMPQPGQYGGAPIDQKIRRTWGGDNKDPLSADEYMWNSDWRKVVDAELKEEERATGSKGAAAVREDEEPCTSAGFLSLGRTIALDSLDIDLSAELNRPAKSSVQMQLERLREELEGPSSSSDAETEETTRVFRNYNFAPTKNEQKRWDQSSKFKSGGSDTLSKKGKEAELDPIAVKLREAENFQKLKLSLFAYTFGIGAAAAGGTYFAYSPEVALSYCFGLLGAFAYIRMLSNSIEALGEQSMEGAIKGSLGQQRLLVPVILVLLFNRWNDLLVEPYSLPPLQLIPMLVGFFTYKAATLVQTFEDVFKAMAPPPPPPVASSASSTEQTTTRK